MQELSTYQNFGLTERKGQAVVSSRQVAEKFGRNHKHVLDNIRNLTEPTSGLSEKFIALNFEVSTYKDSTGRKLPEYLLTKDGFSMVVMEFKTKKARQFKEAYINAFNQMESFIKNLLEAKADFPEFTDAIMAAHEEPKHYHFSNECNMINDIVLGMSAKKYREQHSIESGKSIRPYLTPEQIHAIKSLQRIDIGLVISIPDFQQRKQILTEQFIRLSQKLLSA